MNTKTKMKEKTDKPKTWWDFINYKDRQDIPESVQIMDEKLVRDLLANKKAKRDHSMTSRNDKMRLRNEVWVLEKLVSAYDKANEANL